MPNWIPEKEIDPGIAKDWKLKPTEQELLGAMAVTPGMKLAEAAGVSGVGCQSARNAMCKLRRRLTRAKIIRPDCGDTDALVQVYLLAESRTGSVK